VTAAAAFTAWLGASVIVLADARRGLALGLALVAVAFAVLAWTGGEPLGAAALLVGGAVVVIQRLRSGPDVWGLMPPGSTPRLILVIASGVLVLWIALSVTSGPGAPLRFASIAVVGLMGARLLTAHEPAVVLTAVAGMAIAVATAAGLAPTPPGPVPYAVAALIAAGVSVLRVATTRAA
jgi:hypothetical protein